MATTFAHTRDREGVASRYVLLYDEQRVSLLTASREGIII
jgi:hypothetical protein